MAPNLPPQWAQRFIVPSTFSRSGGSRTSLKRARRNKRKPPPNHEASDSPRFHSTGSLAPCNLEGSSSLWIPVSTRLFQQWDARTASPQLSKDSAHSSTRMWHRPRHLRKLVVWPDQPGRCATGLFCSLPCNNIGTGFSDSSLAYHLSVINALSRG
jgi:hypothetical protein